MPSPNSDSGNQRFFAVLLPFCHLLLIFLCVGETVPGVNESHYLPKAKHVWDPSFAPNDLFLESHDSHFLSSFFAGVLAIWLSLPAVAWVGRLVSWSLMAVAWTRLCAAVRLPPSLSPFALICWLLAIRDGNWAGEWVVGGYEAKAIAYPLVIFGFAAAASNNWKTTWLWLGGAVAWHPLVGGWAGLSLGLVWLIRERGQLAEQLGFQWIYLLGGACLGLVGVSPAAFGLSGPDVVDRVSAAQVHVFMRLPHHMSPQLFSAERNAAGAISLVLLAVATAWFCKGWISQKANTKEQKKLVEADTVKASGPTRSSVGLVLACAWVAIGFAAIGLIIDFTLSQKRPDIAARLLRFYWFRWADVIVPLAVSMTFWSQLASWARSDRPLSLQQPPHPADAVRKAGRAKRVGISDGSQKVATAVLGGAILLTLVWAISRSKLASDPQIAPADRLVVETVGPRKVSPDRYVDWLAVCQWIRNNTPPDSLWLTPKYQQSFKWYAQRAEVVCWKDVPQDNAAVIEWFHRVNDCRPRRGSTGFRDWTTEELTALAAKYNSRWVLLDRTFQSHPPALELMYPAAENGMIIENRSFAVFRIPDGLVQTQPNK